jgi:hypothetical protein
MRDFVFWNVVRYVKGVKIINAIEPQVPISLEFAAVSDPLESLKQRRLCELIDALESSGPSPEVCAVLIGVRDPEILFANNGVVVKVRVDWMDYGPLSNGPPATHFRVVARRDGVDGASDESRHVSTEEAARAIASALAASAQTGDDDR